MVELVKISTSDIRLEAFEKVQGNMEGGRN